MGRKRVMVQLDELVLEVLNQRAATGGRSRDDLIREAVEHHFKKDIEARIDAVIVEGYQRVPDDGEFDALAEANARRLIAEELW
jgi:metal-responsive CopG/Arc/MetJ family transcriptional regulator